MAFVKSSILKSGGALSAHLRKKKTTVDEIKVKILIEEPEEDEVTEPESIDPVEGETSDVTVAVEEEEKDEQENVATPSSPRSKLRSLFTIGSINSVSDVVETQVDGDAAEDANITERIDVVELDHNRDEQQEQHEEERDEEEDLSRIHRYNSNEGIKMKGADDDDQSQQSETSLQVLFRIVATGLDFATDYDGRNNKSKRQSRNSKTVEKQKPVPSTFQEVATNKENESPKEFIDTMNDDMTHVSELSATSDLVLTSTLTLTLAMDGDAGAGTAGCANCAPIISVFEDYE